MINELQKQEFIAAETILMDRLARINPLVKSFIFNSPNVTAKIDQVEAGIELCMKENGLVDGKLLGELVAQKFPKACQWINVPKQEFRLSDEISKLLTFLLGD